MFKKFKLFALLVSVLLATICQHQPVNSAALVSKSIGGGGGRARGAAYKAAITNTNTNNYKDRVIGCLFAEVCGAGQICFDDNAFGRCEEWDIRSGSYSSNFVHRLDRKTLQLLATELNRLNENEYSWDDEYTQCTLKAVLNDRPRIVYNPQKCDKFQHVEVGGGGLVDEDGGGGGGAGGGGGDGGDDDGTGDDADGGNYNNNHLLGPAIEKFLADQLLPGETLDLSAADSPRGVSQSASSLSKNHSPLSSYKLSTSTHTNTNTHTQKKQHDKTHTTPSTHSISSFPPIYPQANRDILFDRVPKPAVGANSRAIINVDEKNCDGGLDCSQGDDDVDDDVELVLEPTGVGVLDVDSVVELPPINYDESTTTTTDDNVRTNEYFDRLTLSYLNGGKGQNEKQTNGIEAAADGEGNYLEGDGVDYLEAPKDRVLRGIIPEDNVDSEEDKFDEDAGLVLIQTGANDHSPILFINKKGDTFALTDGKKVPLDTDDDSDDKLALLDNEFDDQEGEDDGEDILKEMPLEDINYSNNNNNNDDEEGGNFNRMHRYDTKKPGPRYIEEYFFENVSTKNDATKAHKDKTQTLAPAAKQEATNKPEENGINLLLTKPVAEGPVKVDAKSKDILIVRSASKGEDTNLEAIDSSHTYVITDNIMGEGDARKFIQTLEQLFKLPRGSFSNSRNEGYQLTFKVNPNYRNLNASQVAARIEDMASKIRNLTGLAIKESGIGNKAKLPLVSPSIIRQKNQKFISLVLMTCSIVLAFIMAAFVIFLFQRSATLREKVKTFTKELSKFDYRKLYRNDKKDVEKGEEEEEEEVKEKMLKNVDTNLANQHVQPEMQPSPPSRSSTSSWALEDPIITNMDITTGHVILSYMEDHLKKKDRLEKEWENLCAYEADPCTTNAALQKQNANKNRYSEILPYDHSRVILDDTNNIHQSDYINASAITDHDPQNPAYIATQGPLANTKADFWQMVWEQGSVVIVMLTRLRENGLSMCERYWPEEGSERVHNFEVHLVSEHIWCDDYLVRSFYLKYMKTGETRTVSQFHFLSWPDNGIPPNAKSILEFRRKISKSYKGRSCPMVVHCNDGIGRTGVYVLIDMVLNRLAKGTKEIDIAATLEHIRDQRLSMIKTKAQFEFVLLAVAEEIQAILKTLAPSN